MVSVITGDLIKSRNLNSPTEWISVLKDSLTNISNNPSNWEMYRGDSFQLEQPDIIESFINAIYIKACIKTIKGLDVRLAIGIGNKTYQGENITESNGDAFLFSGETLESLKKEKQNLKIKTPNETLNQELNLYFKLALIAMDSWTTNTAEIVKLTLEHPDALQETLGNIIGINQNAVSGRQKRAHLDEILKLDAMYRRKISNFIL
ncbi:transcriptional regulator [Hanstruepera ponticola]|uniref:transcriptional regulator n=1 Tax=Hanstruepera ponticola TaxID=2042995 RepID=UPI000CF175F5|nr:transcriptional regulator [Hanstruepera ponticola]